MICPLHPTECQIFFEKHELKIIIGFFCLSPGNPDPGLVGLTPRFMMKLVMGILFGPPRIPFVALFVSQCSLRVWVRPLEGPPSPWATPCWTGTSGMPPPCRPESSLAVRFLLRTNDVAPAVHSAQSSQISAGFTVLTDPCFQKIQPFFPPIGVSFPF